MVMSIVCHVQWLEREVVDTIVNGSLVAGSAIGIRDVRR
jgi:hypothetical protein